jgi:hypothetical protein
VTTRPDAVEMVLPRHRGLFHALPVVSAAPDALAGDIS